MAAQNSAIRTNHTKARIDKTQQNSKCRLCGDRDETINHIIGECNKLAQKEYKATHNWNFDIQTDHLIFARRPNLIIINKRKKICKIVDSTVPVDHRIKQREFEKRDKYLDLAREVKNLWNMKVTIIPVMIDAFGTVTKGLLKGLKDLEDCGWVETIQTTALLKTVRILRRILETWGDLLSLNLRGKTVSLRWCEKI